MAVNLVIHGAGSGYIHLLYTNHGEDVTLIVGPPTVDSGGAMAWIHRHRPEIGQYPGCRCDATSVNGNYWEVSSSVFKCFFYLTCHVKVL
ncbi:hypothetical protein DPMN_178902 [Dreissena polymorpha]|uniref:Uncharacterized protein n=1 Tax=Dreissena polymorpha TaxID=45954 RepID=A0A9D4IKA5_DREPO|nr:hypothetical protein DPMN_178902 [Dreissena polymorpha]